MQENGLNTRFGHSVCLGVCLCMWHRAQHKGRGTKP